MLLQSAMHSVGHLTARCAVLHELIVRPQRMLLLNAWRAWRILNADR
jgi:hypothetical protein